MLLFDVVFVIVELSTIGKETGFPLFTQEIFEILSLIFAAYFCIEVSLRIFGEG